jgi:hypothetical protein
MKSLKIINIAFLVSLFSTGVFMTYSESQPPIIPPGKPIPQAPMKGACRKDPSITFTEEQTKKLEKIESAFMEETKPLLSELRDLRLELRFAVSDPQAQPQVLLDKQRRLASIQTKLENLRFSYLIKARAIFTKEQLERMPPDCPLKMGTGYGIGRGLERGPRKGWR